MKATAVPRMKVIVVMKTRHYKVLNDESWAVSLATAPSHPDDWPVIAGPLLFAIDPCMLGDSGGDLLGLIDCLID